MAPNPSTPAGRVPILQQLRYGGNMLSKPASCEGCPAHHVGSGFVPPSGPSDARLAIVGQGPGADEAALGEPFVGMSGRHLGRWLARAGVPRERLAIGNIVQCWLPKNRKPVPREIEHCREAHVGPWLRSLSALRVIVPTGLPAAQQFIRGAKASTAGTVTRSTNPPAVVVPIVHPSAIIRGQWAYDPAQPRFLARAWAIASSEDAPIIPDVTVAPPDATIAESVAEAIEFLDALVTDQATVACDIEGTGGILIGIGFARLDSLRAMYVPFRDRAKPRWSPEDTATIAEHLDAVLADPGVSLVFHNGSSFDIPFLEGIGFVVAGYADDTMVRAWAIYHEMGKSLQELAILYAGLPAWKHTSHVGDEGEGK